MGLIIVVPAFSRAISRLNPFGLFGVINMAVTKNEIRSAALMICDKAAAPQGCTAEWTYKGTAGKFNISVQYFDLQGGAAKFTLEVNGKSAASWTADGTFPWRQPHGDNSTRYTARGIQLKPGDVLKVTGIPDGNDAASLDYVEVAPPASPAE